MFLLLLQCVGYISFVDPASFGFLIWHGACSRFDLACGIRERVFLVQRESATIGSVRISAVSACAYSTAFAVFWFPILR